MTIRANKSKRTFTIRKGGLKYRTNPMTQDEFDCEENNTKSDWQHFLNLSCDYYLVKKNIIR